MVPPLVDAATTLGGRRIRDVYVARLVSRPAQRSRGGHMKLAAIASALVLLTTAPSAAAVDEGAPDRDRHRNVGLLGFDLDGGGPMPAALLCSGSVISDE